MISGPTHPLTRDGLWQLVCERPELFERGLRVVGSAFEGPHAALGPIDGLARDAGGAPVFVLIVEPDDPLLLPRLMAGHAFLERNAAALVRAVPEAELEATGSFRVMLVGAEIPSGLIVDLGRLQLPQVRAFEVTSFRVGGHERFGIRPVWPSPEGVPDLDPAVAAPVRASWESLIGLLGRMDAAIRFDGDRFSRRAFWYGRLLCEFWFADDRLLAQVPGGSVRALVARGDVQVFADQVMRRLVAMLAEREAGREGAAGPVHPRVPVPDAEAAADAVARSGPLAGLRSTLGASRLTREEYSALGDLAAEEHVPEGY